MIIRSRPPVDYRIPTIPRISFRHSIHYLVWLCDCVSNTFSSSPRLRLSSTILLSSVSKFFGSSISSFWVVWTEVGASWGGASLLLHTRHPVWFCGRFEFGTNFLVTIWLNIWGIRSCCWSSRGSRHSRQSWRKPYWCRVDGMDQVLYWRPLAFLKRWMWDLVAVSS